jgi:hypothetical protein
MGLFDDLGSSISDGASDAAAAAERAASDAAEAAAQAAADAAATAAQDAADKAVADAMDKAVDAVPEAVGNTIDKAETAVDNVEKKVDEVESKVQDVENKVQDVASKAQDYTSQAQDYASQIENAGQTLQDAAGNLEQKAQDTVANVENQVQDKIANVENQAQDKIANVENQVQDKIANVQDQVQNTVNDYRDQIQGRIDQVKDKYVAVIGNVTRLAEDKQAQLQQGITKGMDALNTIYPAKTEHAVADVQENLTTLFGSGVEQVIGKARSEFTKYQGQFGDLKKSVFAHAQKTLDQVIPDAAKNASAKLTEELDKAKGMLAKISGSDIVAQLAELQKTLEEMQKTELTIEADAAAVADDVSQVEKAMQAQAADAMNQLKAFALNAQTTLLDQTVGQAKQVMDQFHPEQIQQGIDAATQTLSDIANGVVDMAASVKMPTQPIGLSGSDDVAVAA